MISSFGIVMRDIRKNAGDSLIVCAKKLEVTPAFLSSMEVGRKSIPTYYPDKIKELYNLNENYFDSNYRLKQVMKKELKIS